MNLIMDGTRAPLYRNGRGVVSMEMPEAHDDRLHLIPYFPVAETKTDRHKVRGEDDSHHVIWT